MSRQRVAKPGKGDDPVAELVGVVGVQHNPLLWRELARPERADLRAVRAAFDDVAARVALTRPDVVVIVTTDHLRQWFYDNMPTFLVGKADGYPATFPDESRDFGIPTAELSGDAEVGGWLHRDGLARGFDLAGSDDLRVDHSVMIPLLFLLPSLQVPIVPVFTNTMAPPFPSATRYYELGRVLRRSIESCPLRRRVLVIGSGHTATEVGGPRQFRGSPGPEFDEASFDCLRTGEPERLIELCSDDTLVSAGNLTHQFLNFVVAFGVAGGRPADRAQVVPSPFSSSPFLEWYADATGPADGSTTASTATAGASA